MSHPRRLAKLPLRQTRLRRVATVASALLALALTGACGGGAGSGGGGGGGPPPPGALSVASTLPAGTNEAATNTAIYIRFSKAVSAANAAAAFSLFYVDSIGGSETPVATTRVTSLPAVGAYPGVADLDAISDGTLFIFKPDSDLNASTDTGGQFFYRIRIAAGLAAVDGGTLAAEFVQNFGTAAGTDTTPNTLPSDFQVASTAFISGTTLYRQSDEFALTGSYGVGANSELTAALLLVHIDGGGGLPGDLAPVFIPGSTISSTALITGAPAPPAEASYTVTFTIYDPALNGATDSLTWVYDTLPPPAPTSIVRTDGLSGQVAATSIDVDVAHPGPLSATDVDRIRVTGGASTQTQSATGSPETISVPLKLNQTNTLSAVALDAAGNASAAAPSGLVVVHDNIAPAPTLGFTPVLSLGIENRIATPNLVLHGTYSGEIALVEIFDSSDLVTPLASGLFSGNFNLPFSLTADSLTTIEVHVSDNDQPTNTRTYGPWDVYPDTVVDPPPAITAASDGSGACAPSGNPTCVQYDAGSPPGFRTSSTTLQVSGVAERNAVVRILPPGGLFVSSTADASADVFPASGQPNPTLLLGPGVLGPAIISATDALGNTYPETSDAEIIRDNTPPEVPTLNGASATTGSCTVSLGSDLGAAAVLSLVGTFAGDCQDLTLDVDMLDAAPNPDRSKGETLAVRVLDDGTPEETTPQAAPAPPTAVNNTVDVTLPATFEDGIGALPVTSFDATQNESDALNVVVIHRTNGDELLVPRIERLTNMGGGRDGELLNFTVDGMSDVDTRPTNAPMIYVEGRTSPSATATVDVYNEPRPPAGAPDQTGLAVDATTGRFTLTLTPSTADAVNYFTIRVNDASGNPTQQEIELRIEHDDTAPGATPNVTLSSPQGGSPGSVEVRVSDTADPTGLEQFEVAARLYSDVSCATPLPIPEICGATVDESCASLEAAGVTSLGITASVGDFVEIFFRDEAGNASASTFPPRRCEEVLAGRRVLALTDGASSAERGFDLFDLDAPSPTATFVGIPGITQPRVLDFYGNSRVFIVDLDGDTSQRNLFNFNLATQSVDQQFSNIGDAVSLDARFDRSQAALLVSNSTLSSVGVASIDGGGQVPGALLSQIDFPGGNTTNGFPIALRLFPATATAPRNDWALVLRLNPIFFATLTPLSGDVFVFDTDTGTVVLPDPPIFPDTERGLTTAPNPWDAVIPSDGLYFAIAASSTVDGDASYNDMTIVDVSSCPGSCTAADFSATHLALSSPLGAVNGLNAIELIPGSDTLALAVEPLRAGAAGGAVHFLTIDWAAKTVTVDDSLAFTSADLGFALTITADGTEAFVTPSDNSVIHRIAVDVGTKTLANGGADLTVAPATAVFTGTVQAEP